MDCIPSKLIHYLVARRDCGAPMSQLGTKRQFALRKAMSGVGGKADTPVERPDFSL
jgi:hypothetical protein